MADLWELKKSNTHLRTLLSIGGYGDLITGAFAELSKTEETRRNFAQQSVELMVRYGFDGLGIFPWNWGGGGWRGMEW